MSHKKNSKRRQAINILKAKIIDKKYTLDEALNTLKEYPVAKFDQSIEIAVHLGIDTKQADQNLRGIALLPHGTGKKIKVAVLADGDQAKAAQEHGADIIGAEDLIEQIQGGNTDFDILIAQQKFMLQLGKLGRILGPKGLMPNPKDGTVTNDIGPVVGNIKKGKQVGFRAEKDGGIINMPVGRMSFSTEQLLDNIKEALITLNRVKPSSAKGTYFKSVYITSTMGGSVEVDINKVLAA